MEALNPFNMQDEFDKELKKTGDHYLWLSIVFVLMGWPGLCHVMLNTSFAKISNVNFETRCRIPELESKNWTFEQIHRLSAPLGQKIENCTYYKYNYSAIAKMSYDQALQYELSVEQPNVSSCTHYEHAGGAVYSVYEEFSLVCNRATLEEILSISPVYGQIISSIFLLPLADVLGRRCLINWGGNLFLIGALVINLAAAVQTLIVGRILVGMAYTAMIHPIEAIVVEISDVKQRPFRFVVLNLGIGLGFIIIPLIGTKIQHWRHLQWTICSTLLILPLTSWFVPESPRWFMSKGKQTKAWAALRTIRDPVIQSELHQCYQNENRNYMDEMGDHVKEFKPFGSASLWFLTLLFFLVGAVYFKNFIGRFQMKLRTSRSTYFILSGIAEIFSCLFCLPLLVMAGRKVTMAVSFLSGGFAYLAASRLEIGSVESLICLLITDVATAALYAASSLYITEIVPTSHRCTAIGIANGMGAGLSTVIVFHSYHYFVTDHTFFLALACMCFVGAILSCFAHESKQNICDTVEETTRPHTN